MRLMVLVLMLVFPAIALAQTVYTWTDGEGVEHFTDERASIPSGIKVRKTQGEAISEVLTSGVRAGRVSGSGDAGVARTTEIVVSEELDEGAWRRAFLEARQAITVLEEEIDLDRRKVEEVNGMPITHQLSCPPVVIQGSRLYGAPCVTDAEIDRGKLRLARNRKSLERAKEELADLERTASSEAVPQEWRR